MNIRPYTEEDLEAVRSIHERCSDFPLPDLKHPLYVVKEIAERNGKIVALGLIRVTSEAVVIMDLDEPRSVRAEAVVDLIGTGIFKSQKLGLDEMHAFLTGEITHSFADVLKRKFAFQDVEGIPLTLRY